MKDKLTIIWDWNGTLLDDVDIYVDTINVLLAKYKKKPISKEYYKKLFTFPVQNYYSKLGFDIDVRGYLGEIAKGAAEGGKLSGFMGFTSRLLADIIGTVLQLSGGNMNIKMWLFSWLQYFYSHN